MPIYEYEHTQDAPGCDERFETVQTMSSAPLTACPKCGKSCRRILSAFGVNTKGAKGLLSSSNLERHGFTQYSRKGKGYYEKTAGVGPGAIADGD